jgi:uncharacterized protein
VAGVPAALTALRDAARAAVAWKNGGGLTREVAVHPRGSDLGAFDWRVSIAEIRAPGPFSSFPNVERRMAVLSGALSISVDGCPAMRLTAESRPLAFPGEAPAFAAPLAGPVTDLNVMTRRGRFASRLARCRIERSSAVETHATVTLLIAAAELELSCGAQRLALAPLDAALIACRRQCAIASGRGSAYFYLVEISDCAAGDREAAP